MLIELTLYMLDDNIPKHITKQINIFEFTIAKELLFSFDYFLCLNLFSIENIILYKIVKLLNGNF